MYKIFHTIEAVRNTTETAYKAYDIPQDIVREINDEILKASRRGEYGTEYKSTMFYTMDVYEGVSNKLKEEGYYIETDYYTDVKKVSIFINWAPQFIRQDEEE